MSSTAAAKNPLFSACIASIISIIIFATLRFFQQWFSSAPLNTIVGGFAGSCLFIHVLTAVSNIEMSAFGADFQASLFPEIWFCLILAVTATGMVHRVCATTCILFSIIGLYFINQISNKYHGKSAPGLEPVTHHRKAGGKKNK